MITSLNQNNIILYAEDDEDDQQLVEEAFSRYGSNVKIVLLNNGVETLNYLNNLSSIDSSPCLIILDINMPRMNGKEALKKIRETKRFAEVPVILFTTSSQNFDRDFAIQYNAGFITKPIDAEQMKQIADTFIKKCTSEVQKNIQLGKN